MKYFLSNHDLVTGGLEGEGMELQVPGPSGAQYGQAHQVNSMQNNMGGGGLAAWGKNINEDLGRDEKRN